LSVSFLRKSTRAKSFFHPNDLRIRKNLARFALLLPPMPFFTSFILTILAVCFFPFSASAAEEVPAQPVVSRLEIVVSIAEQKLALVKDGEVVRKYTVSTSRYGIGDSYGSYRTPLGRLKISQKIGDGLPAGAVLKSRRTTGEVLAPNAPGRDPIVSRILWLDGQEAANRNAHGRCVYIHGTPDEKRLGRAVSYGCIRMRSADVIELYSAAPVGVDVSIVKGLLPGTNPLLAMLAMRDSAPRSISGKAKL
jgi:L,D-transpeptidase catalytic domain